MTALYILAEQHRAAKAAEKLLRLRAEAIRRVHVLRGLQKVERAMKGAA